MRKHDALRLMLTGDSLRKILRKKGTNKHRVAKATGMSYMALYNWERQRSVPSAERLLIVARHLGLLEDGGPGTLDLLRDEKRRLAQAAPGTRTEEKKGGQNGRTENG